MAPGDPQAVLHVDLDGAAHIYAHHGWDWPHGDDPVFESGMENLLSFLDHNGVKATLFVIASDLDDPKKREVLRRAAAAGHEIASHSLTHPELDDLERDAKRAELAESRAKLEDELQVEVQGFRAPSFQVDRATIELLAECGYAFDSSVFPDATFARRLGVGAVEPFPHRPVEGVDVLELPMPAHRPLPFPFHPCYALMLGKAYFSLGLGRFRKLGHPLVLLFHLTDFCDPLPKERLVGWKSRVYTVSNKSAAAKRALCQSFLNRIRTSFEVTDTRTLRAAWA